MKNLFLMISWLELVRNRTRSWLLLIIIIAFSFALSTCGRTEGHFDMQSGSGEFSQSVPDSNPGSGTEYSLPAAFPPFAITGITFILGFLVLMTIPFRGKQEWEDGQFQMIAMGDHSFYKVELTRFLSYLSLAALFFVAVLLCSGVFCWKYELFPLASILKLQWVAVYKCASFLPLMLAFGILVSAINTAYYRDGNYKLLTLVKYVSCLSFFVLAIKTGEWFEDASHNLLPAMQVFIDIPGGNHITIALNWEFPVLSILTAVLLIYWAGRILEEVEA